MMQNMSGILPRKNKAKHNMNLEPAGKYKDIILQSGI